MDADLAVAGLTVTKTSQDVRWRPLTGNEHAWIEFLRLASNDTDPAPTLERVQALRLIFSG